MSVVILSGGVGGAKLVDGMAQILLPDALSVIVNTADDFTHLGLKVCPDIDSVLYMLSGKADAVRGWGIAGESWNFMAALAEWEGPDWFNLGDRDLAMHVLRTEAMARNQSLTTFTARMAAAAGIRAHILPMSEDPVATIIETRSGELPFQHYFVKHHCKPTVRAIRFQGAETARPSPDVLAALSNPSLETIIIAPSNPYLSIDPILAVPGIRDALRDAAVPVIAISPLVAGKAVKGPAAKLMQELGLTVSHKSIAEHYTGLIDGIVVDRLDFESVIPCASIVLDTMMKNAADRKRVATETLSFARTMR